MFFWFAGTLVSQVNKEVNEGEEKQVIMLNQ